MARRYRRWPSLGPSQWWALPYSGHIGGLPAPPPADAAAHGGAAFVGRRTALDAARRRFDRARGHEAQVVWVEGAIGAGKSTFVRELVTEAGADGLDAPDTVLWAQGEELASDVSFALLSQLVPVDSATPFAAGMGLLGHLGSLPIGGTVIVVVEDVQWADPASMTALLAVAQRLHHDQVVLVLTSRPGARLDGWGRFLLDTERCLRLVLDGLDDDEVRELARSHGVQLDVAQAARLRTHTGGHPLYVGALLRELTPEQLRSTSGELPAPPSLAAVVLGSIAALSADTQALADALAVLGGMTPLAVAGQVGGVDDPTEALEGLVANGLANWLPAVTGTPVELSHPLVRHAVYDDLSPRRRRDLHLAAAGVTRWGVSWAHRVAAADRPDDELADELEAGARYEVARRDLSLAATYLSWASTVSSSRERSEECLLLGVRLLLIDGQTARADTLVPRVEQCAETALRDLVLGMLAFSHADAASTERWFTSVARLAGPPWVAADALAHLALLRTLQGRGADVVVAAEGALATGALDGVGTDRNVWRALAIGVAMQEGAVAGLARLDERLAEPASEVSVDDAELLAVRGMLRFYAGRTGEGVADLRASIQMARDGAPYQQLPRAHLSLAQALYLAGEWDESQVHSHTALSLMDDHRVWMGQLAEGSLVPVIAARGQFELADQYAAAVRAAAEALGTTELDGVARLATATLARARGDAAGVVAALDPLTELAHPNGGPIGLLLWWPMLITARIDAGSLDVDDEIDAFVAAGSAARLDVTGRAAELRARLAAARGDADVAAAEFERAIDATGPDAPVLERALLHHAYGRLLRDRGSRRQALVQLRTAHELLLRLGAEAYRTAVADDLAAWSERAPAADGRSPLTLTAREQDVVSLVMKGLTNREIGAQLYISAKAVEYHLANVYGKLGIRSRRELRDALALTSSVAR